METADYVDYQTAVALKECGFDEPCEMFYPDNIKIPCSEISPFPKPRNWNVVEGKTSAVPLLQVQKWLREVKGLHIAITWGYSFQWLWFGLHITKFPKGDEFEKGNFGYSTYEQALSAGISASLELIKKGE